MYLKAVSLRFSLTSQVSLRELYSFQRIRYSFLILKTKYAQQFLVYGWNFTYATHFKQASYLPFLYFVCNSTLFQLESKGFSFFSIYSPWNLQNQEHLSCGNSPSNDFSFVRPPYWIPKFTPRSFNPLTAYDFWLWRGLF